MSDMKQNRVYLDPHNVEQSLQSLASVYDLDAELQDALRVALALYPHRVFMYVDEANASLYADMPLTDKFTFNLQTDELILFSRDPNTFIDAVIEMAMYTHGFLTLMGSDDFWKVEFTVGAWKPVRRRIKRALKLPVLEAPQWVVGLPPPPDQRLPEDPHPFRTLVSQLDFVSFTQMVRLAARDDVEVRFPPESDPRVLDVYRRMRLAMQEVADGIGLDDWREFNHRLLMAIQEIEAAYQPRSLPVPGWWQKLQDDLNTEAERVPAVQGQEAPPSPPLEPGEAWDPFEEFIETLFGDDDARNRWGLV